MTIDPHFCVLEYHEFNIASSVVSALIHVVVILVAFLLRDLSTQLRAVLATQHVLEGVGVGRPGATALSAMLNFVGG